MYLGDFPEDFTTVTCMFTTHASTGAPVAPLSAFEAADVVIYKNGSGTQRATADGVTMTSPFDSIAGLHCVVIDTSNNTGDGGFWVAGAQYTLVLSPDETVDGITVAKVIGTFGIELSEVLRPTTAGRQLDVSAGGEAGIDWANIGSPTTAVNLSGTNIDADQIVASVSGAVGSVTGAVGSVTGLTASDVGAIKTKTDFLPSATAGSAGGVFIAGTNAATVVTTSFTTTFTGNLTGSVGSVTGAVGSVAGLTASNLDATVSSRASQASVDTIDDLLDLEVAAIKTVVDAIQAKTDTIPSDPADASDIAALVDALPTANENADALLDRAAGVETNRTPRQALRLMLAALAGKASGLATTTAVFRDTNDSLDRITATVDADGNRTAVTLDAS
jgi:hypothetical protein